MLTTECYKILIIFPTASPTRERGGEGIGEKRERRGSCLSGGRGSRKDGLGPLDCSARGRHPGLGS